MTTTPTPEQIEEARKLYGQDSPPFTVFEWDRVVPSRWAVDGPELGLFCYDRKEDAENCANDMNLGWSKSFLLNQAAYRSAVAAEQGEKKAKSQIKILQNCLARAVTLLKEKDKAMGRFLHLIIGPKGPLYEIDSSLIEALENAIALRIDYQVDK